MACLSIYFFVNSGTSLYYSDSKIDDRYGSLNTNEKKIIEENIIKIMKEKRINVYFSYVYNEINETYKDNLYCGEKYIIFCYNNNNATLKVLSDIEAVKKLNLNYNIENNNIKVPFEDTVKSISTIDKQSKKMFYSSETIHSVAILISFFSFIIFFCIFLSLFLSYNIEKTLEKCKENIREYAIKKANENTMNNDEDCTCDIDKTTK